MSSPLSELTDITDQNILHELWRQDAEREYTALKAAEQLGGIHDEDGIRDCFERLRAAGLIVQLPSKGLGRRYKPSPTGTEHLLATSRDAPP